MTSIADGPAQALGRRQVRAITACLMFSVFLAALDQTIISTAIVKIANDLRGFDLQVWAVAAYLISISIVAPIYGKLSDIYGRRPLFLLAVSIFLVGSVATASAQSMFQLAVFRGLQGLGAGGLLSLAMTIFSDILLPREAPRYQGYSVAVFGVATLLGPLIGGTLTDVDVLAGIPGWRWAFLLNLPIGLTVLFMAARTLKFPHRRHRQRIDWWGTAALIVGVVPPLVVAELGSTWGWTSRNALISYAIGAFGIITFIVIEKRMKDAALIPLRLFGRSTFTIATIGCVVVGMAIFGSTSLVPQYLQVVGGYTATQAGLLLLPQMAGIMMSSAVSGRIIGVTGRYKMFPIAGTLLTAAGAFLFAQVQYSSPVWFPLTASVVMGLGFGSCLQPLVVAVQSAGPRGDRGVSIALATFFRELGGTAGIAVFLTIVITALPGAVTQAFGGHSPPGLLAELQKNTGITATLPDALKIPVLTGFTHAVTTAFYVAGVVALLAAVLLFAMKEVPLPKETPATLTVEGTPPAVYADSALTGPLMALGSFFPGPPASPRSPTLRQALFTGEPSPSTGLADVAAAVPPRTGGYSQETTNGHAVRRQLAGYLRRPNGTPVTSANLTLVDEHGRQVVRTTAAPSGTYTLPAPSPGRFMLIVSADGHRPYVSAVAIKDGPTQLDLTLTGVGRLAGVVRDADTGSPIPYATVTVTDWRGEVNDTCITAQDGRYTLSCLGTGHYTLVANQSNYRPAALSLFLRGNGPHTQDVELVGAQVPTAQNGHSFSGDLADTEQGWSGYFAKPDTNGSG